MHACIISSRTILSPQCWSWNSKCKPTLRNHTLNMKTFFKILNYHNIPTVSQYGCIWMLVKFEWECSITIDCNKRWFWSDSTIVQSDHCQHCLEDISIHPANSSVFVFRGRSTLRTIKGNVTSVIVTSWGHLHYVSVGVAPEWTLPITMIKQHVLYVWTWLWVVSNNSSHATIIYLL